MAAPGLVESVDARGVATLTLARPDRHNALDEALIAALDEAVGRLEGARAVRVLVLAAEGASFCAGADVGAMRRAAALDMDDNIADAAVLARLLRRLDGCAKPTIARVQGAAFGGGVGLVACCDVAIAAATARFALSEVKLGLIPATIGPAVIAAIGARQARRYFQTAEAFDAAAARSLGLVHEVVAADELDAAVARVVQALLQGAPAAQAEAKRLVTFCRRTSDAETLERETALRLARRRRSPEAREGLAAFLEKRRPAWPEE